ncbi:hypothetical protein [Pseudoalteromonas sp. Of7M-16]|uniref:hypothetical protein n=1 Tax=Pseudoalteromonas sp. Of7M-16 TaxID=2917756 RepID=UPI001EF74F37|nr:hypothetical protein [Pseudoalteromonas sp. Of7M-16]MCG7546953.1 hypothetical protein [Pseudoalteromonas sp. Of7M-16]
MTELENIGKLAATASELISAIRGGEIANMKAEHTQTLEGFVTAYNAKIDEFVQQKGEVLNQFNTDKAQAFAEADSELQQRRVAVDAVLNDLYSSHSHVRKSYYDRQLHSKESMVLVQDPANSHMSKWQPVPVSSEYEIARFQTPSYGALTMLHLIRARTLGVAADGSSNHTKLQFVIASNDATSEQINEKLAADGVVLRTIGADLVTPSVEQIEALHIAGGHPYAMLFVRFVNVPYNGASLADISKGASVSFVIDQVVNYPNINIK